MPIDLKGTTAIPAGVRAALGLPISVKLYGAVGDGTTDDTAAIQAAIDATPDGGLLWLPDPSVHYAVSDPLVVDKPITIRSSCGRTLSDVPHGAILRPTNAAAQAAMAALIDVTHSYVRLEGLAVYGFGSGEGGVGVRFVGTIGEHTHACKMDGVYVAGFETNVEMGAYSDHVTLTGCEVTEGVDGVQFSANNQFDFAFIDCILAGNTRSSLFIPEDVSTRNITCLRTHLGFSEYAVLQDPLTDNGNGLAGLTLIDSPIETVSEQFISVEYGGNIRAIGGYWLWDGTPAESAVRVGTLNYGPVEIAVDLSGTNASSPSIVAVDNFSNYETEVKGEIGTFALARYSGNVRPVQKASSLGIIATNDPGLFSAASPIGAANRATYMRVKQGGPVSKIGLHVGVQSGNISVAVYRNAGLGRSAEPGSRLATSGAVACPVSGYAEVSLGSTVELFDGDWIALSCDNNTASFYGVGGTGGFGSNLTQGVAGYEESAHPLPSNPTPSWSVISGGFILLGIA